MKVEWFLARRIYGGEGGEGLPAAVGMAVSGVALGLGVMILSVSILVGFKREVGEKVVGFGGHVVVSNFDSNVSYESEAISVGGGMVDRLRGIEGVRSASAYATKPGILKTEEDFQGVVMKGVGEGYDWSFFGGHVKEGRWDSVGIQGGILLSRALSDLVGLGVGDDFLMYFVGKGVKVRKCVVRGIYETGFAELDRMFVLGGLEEVQGLNGWESDEVSGVEVLASDFRELEEVSAEVETLVGGRQDARGNTYYVRTVKELYGSIFGWLEVLDLNVVVILLLMVSVSGFTMIAGLLILILERTQMIGLLKGMGMGNGEIRRTFLYVSILLIGRGLLWGNVVGVGSCLIQKYVGVIPLDAEIYYLSSVPIALEVWWWSLLNVGTLLVTLGMLVIPSYLISRIRPVEAMRFE